MNKASRANRSAGSPDDSGSKLGTPFLWTVAILLAASMLTPVPSLAQIKTEQKPTASQVKPGLPPQQPSLKLSSSRDAVGSCPGEESSAQVQLKASGFA